MATILLAYYSFSGFKQFASDNRQQIESHNKYIHFCDKYAEILLRYDR